MGLTKAKQWLFIHNTIHNLSSMPSFRQIQFITKLNATVDIIFNIYVLSVVTQFIHVYNNNNKH